MEGLMTDGRPKLSIVSSNRPEPGPGNDITSKSIDAHATLLGQLPGFEAETLRTIFQQIVEDGPQSLVEPIEAEFAKRGLDPYTLKPVTK
jgi:hypothetical protein